MATYTKTATVFNFGTRKCLPPSTKINTFEQLEKDDLLRSLALL